MTSITCDTASSEDHSKNERKCSPGVILRIGLIACCTNDRRNALNAFSMTGIGPILLKNSLGPDHGL